MKQLVVISLGAGVQSSTMSLMAAVGEIEPMPDCAIFADTGWEPRAVYNHLTWLMTVLPFPVHIVNAGNIRADLMAGGSQRSQKFTVVPFFTVNPDGSHGMGRRQCTSHYKVEPIRRKIRELLGRSHPKPVPPGACEKWLGISVDEVIRAKPSSVKFEVHRFPLLEKRMRRVDCLAWLQAHRYPIPPKSSCIGCPYHGNDQWRALPEAEFADAVEVDRAIRDLAHKGQQFMHRARVPLDQVDLERVDPGQLDMFLNECEGMCGV